MRHFNTMIIGSHESGKSTITNTFKEGFFLWDYNPTEDTNIVSKVYLQYQFNIFDMAIDSLNKKINLLAFEHCQMFILTFSLHVEKTRPWVKFYFELIKKIRKDYNNIPIVIVGTMKDLYSNTSEQEIKDLLNDLGKKNVQFLTTSARSLESIELVFNNLLYQQYCIENFNSINNILNNFSNQNSSLQSDFNGSGGNGGGGAGNGSSNFNLKHTNQILNNLNSHHQLIMENQHNPDFINKYLSYHTHHKESIKEKESINSKENNKENYCKEYNNSSNSNNIINNNYSPDIKKNQSVLSSSSSSSSNSSNSSSLNSATTTTTIVTTTTTTTTITKQKRIQWNDVHSKLNRLYLIK